MSVYTELFSINITHEYYTDGVCPDFSLEPTPECREILEGHRIVVKNSIDGIQLVLLAYRNTPFIDYSDIEKLSFYMKSNEPAFDIYTDLSVLPVLNTDEIYGYSNQSASGELTLTKIKKSEAGLPVNNVGVFAVIDIDAGQLSGLDTPSQYTIGFTASEIPWSYYFITNPSPSKTTAVNHPTISFNETTINGNDPIGEELQEKYPLSDIRLYRSNDEISYRQKGRKNIEFRVIDDTAREQNTTATETEASPYIIQDTLIEHLPNPGIYDYGVKILKVTI